MFFLGCEVASVDPAIPDIDELRARFEEFDQGHVLRFWDRLDPDARELLARQAAELDLAALVRAFAPPGAARRAVGEIEPPAVELLPEHGGDAARWREARQRGEAALRAGRVAAMVVAGGQATRLGYPGPRASTRSARSRERPLFELQAQKLRRLRAPLRRRDALVRDDERGHRRRRRARASSSTATSACPRRTSSSSARGWCRASTSRTHRARAAGPHHVEPRRPRRLADRPARFGRARRHAAPRHLDASSTTRSTTRSCRSAIRCIWASTRRAGAEMSCKVVRKLDPMEKVGVLARVGGRSGVVEYTELDDGRRDARDARGELRFWAGNMALHVFSVDFLRRVAGDADRWLRFHASEKKIPTVDDDGSLPSRPTRRTAASSSASCSTRCPRPTRSAWSRRRATSTAPVKNAAGPDSPAARARRPLGSATGAGSRKRACARRAPRIGSKSMNRALEVPKTCARSASLGSRTPPSHILTRLGDDA